MNIENAVALRREQLIEKRSKGILGLLSNGRLLTIAVVAALGGLNYGYEQGSYAQVLVMPSFTNNPSFSRIATDPSYKGWTVSTLPLGGWLGSLVNGYIVNKAGRRWAICGASLMCVIGGILTTVATNPAHIFAGRFFIGLAVGMMSTAVPTYESELSPPETRGAVVGLFQLAVTIGIMVSYWCGYGTAKLSDTRSVAWRTPLAIQIIPAAILMFGVWALPESPRHLVNIGKDKEALEILAYIRHTSLDDELTNLELLEIQAESIFEKEVVAERYPHLINRGLLQDLQIEFLQIASLFTAYDTFKRTATGGLCMFFQQWSGIDAIVNYSPTIFTSIGLASNTTSLLASGVVGVLFVVGTIPALILIDLVGRKKLMLAGSIGMLVCLVLVAALSASYGDDWGAHKGLSWFSVVLIWIYIGHFAFSWGPCSWTIIAEIFPLSTRGAGVAFSASSNWINNFIVSYTVPIMLDKIGYKTYIIFICTLALGSLWVVFLLPETRGKSLEEMDIVFHSRAGERDIRRMQDISDRIGLTKRAHVHEKGGSEVEKQA